MTKIRLIFLPLLFCLIAQVGLAQKGKIGYIHTNDLWAAIPEKAQADSMVSVHHKELNDHFNQMVADYNQKLAAIQGDTLADQESMLYKSKVEELVSLQKRIEDFKENGEKEIATKREALYKPIRDRMQKAIDTVADREGYDYILDASFGNIVYRRKEEFDIMPLVKKELGI